MRASRLELCCLLMGILLPFKLGSSATLDPLGGPWTLVSVLCSFPDRPDIPSKEEHRNGGQDLIRFFTKVSYGRSPLTFDDYGPFRLQRTWDSYVAEDSSDGGVHALIRACGDCFSMAYDLNGVIGGPDRLNQTSYETYACNFPKIGHEFPFTGWTATALRGGIFQSGGVGYGLASHELGHLMGLGHANLLLPGWDNPQWVGGFGGLGSVELVTYGDVYSTMGGQRDGDGYSLYHKERLGWLSVGDEIVVCDSLELGGTYFELTSFDHFGAPGNLLGLKIPWKFSIPDNYIYTAQFIGNTPRLFDAYRRGLKLVHGAIQLHMTYRTYIELPIDNYAHNVTELIMSEVGPPFGYSAWDAPIAVGQMFIDPNANPRLAITPIFRSCPSKGIGCPGDNCTIPCSMKVHVYRGDPTGDPPSFTISGLTHQELNPSFKRTGEMVYHLFIDYHPQGQPIQSINAPGNSRAVLWSVKEKRSWTNETSALHTNVPMIRHPVQYRGIAFRVQVSDWERSSSSFHDIKLDLGTFLEEGNFVGYSLGVFSKYGVNPFRWRHRTKLGQVITRFIWQVYPLVPPVGIDGFATYHNYAVAAPFKLDPNRNTTLTNFEHVMLPGHSFYYVVAQIGNVLYHKYLDMYSPTLPFSVNFRRDPEDNGGVIHHYSFNHCFTGLNMLPAKTVRWSLDSLLNESSSLIEVDDQNIMEALLYENTLTLTKAGTYKMKFPLQISNWTVMAFEYLAESEDRNLISLQQQSHYCEASHSFLLSGPPCEALGGSCISDYRVRTLNSLTTVHIPIGQLFESWGRPMVSSYIVVEKGSGECGGKSNVPVSGRTHFRNVRFFEEQSLLESQILRNNIELPPPSLFDPAQQSITWSISNSVFRETGTSFMEGPAVSVLQSDAARNNATITINVTSRLQGKPLLLERVFNSTLNIRQLDISREDPFYDSQEFVVLSGTTKLSVAFVGWWSFLLHIILSVTRTSPG